MSKKLKKTEEVEETNEFAAEAEAQGDISHDEAVAASKPAANPDGELKKPEVQGHRPEDYGPPKSGPSSVQKREVIGEDSEQK